MLGVAGDVLIVSSAFSFNEERRMLFGFVVLAIGFVMWLVGRNL
jgi:hypothetical protein